MTTPTDTLLQFPCHFPIKIIGKADGNFEPLVIRLLFEHFPNIAENAIVLNPSRNENYMAITATVYAQNKQEIDNLYYALTKEPNILMVL